MSTTGAAINAAGAGRPRLIERRSSFTQTLAFQIAALAINVVTGVVTARLLGPHGRGELTAVVIWPELLAGLSTIGLPAAIIYHSNARRAVNAQQIAAASCVYGLLTSIAVLIAAQLSIPWILARSAPGTVALALAGAGLCVVNTGNIILRTILLTDQRLFVYNVSHILPASCYLVGLIGCIIASGGALRPAPAAWCVLLSGVPAIFWLGTRAWPRLQWSGVAQSLRLTSFYAGRAAGLDLATVLSNYLDRILLIYLLSPRDLGLYAVAYSLSRVVNVVQVACGAIFLPNAAGRTPSEIKQQFSSAITLGLTSIVVIAIAVAVGGSALMRLLYGEAFRSATLMLQLLVVEACLTSLFQLAAQCFVALGRPGIVSLVNCASLVMVFASMGPAVGKMGAIGGAIVLVGVSGLRLSLVGGVLLPRVGQSLAPRFGSLASLPISARLMGRGVEKAGMEEGD